eukprot:2544292-Amphidinium_carterae.3
MPTARIPVLAKAVATECSTSPHMHWYLESIPSSCRSVYFILQQMSGFTPNVPTSVIQEGK